jgi:hypothetical protein
MNFLQTELWAGPQDEVQVGLDAQANVLLLDDPNFSLYQQGRSFTYYGGWTIRSPVRLSPPHQGRWNVVIDLGGRAGRVKASIRLLRPVIAERNTDVPSGNDDEPRAAGR